MSLAPDQFPTASRSVERCLTSPIHCDSRQHKFTSCICENLKHASLFHRSINGCGGDGTLPFDKLPTDVILGKAVAAYGRQVAGLILEDVDGDGWLKGGWGGKGRGN